MNDQPRINNAILHGRHNFVEGHHNNVANAARHLLLRPEAEQKIGGGALAWHGDGFARQPGSASFAGCFFASEHKRAAASPKRPAARDKAVMIQYPR
ncbi:hypothetical protein D3C85_1388480 [compost metagenome]